MFSEKEKCNIENIDTSPDSLHINSNTSDVSFYLHLVKQRSVALSLTILRDKWI